MRRSQSGAVAGTACARPRAEIAARDDVAYAAPNHDRARRLRPQRPGPRRQRRLAEAAVELPGPLRRQRARRLEQPPRTRAAPAAAASSIAVLDTGVAYAQPRPVPALAGLRRTRSSSAATTSSSKRPLRPTTRTATARTSPARSPSDQQRHRPDRPGLRREDHAGARARPRRRGRRRRRSRAASASPRATAPTSSTSPSSSAPTVPRARDPRASRRDALRQPQGRGRRRRRRATRATARSPTPRARRGVIAVGATTEHGCLADYSNHGTGPRHRRPRRRRRRDARRRPRELPARRRPRPRHLPDDLRRAAGAGAVRRSRPGYEGTSMAVAARRGDRRARDRQPACIGAEPDAARGRAPPQAAPRATSAPAGLRQSLRRGPHRRRRAATAPRRSPARSARPLGRPDDQDAAGRVVGDLVRHRAEQEALGAGHALVADDDQVGAPSPRRRRGSRRPGRPGGRRRRTSTPAASRPRPRPLERRVDVLARVDHPLQVVGDLLRPPRAGARRTPARRR